MMMVDVAAETLTERRARMTHVELLATASHYTEQMDTICRVHGLTMQQYTVLFVLCLDDRASDGVPMGAIADGQVNRASDTTRLVDRLVGSQLAERLADPTDRRVVRVRATQRGKRAFENAAVDVLAFHRAQWQHLSLDEVDQLRHLLHRARWGNHQPTITTDGTP